MSTVKSNRMLFFNNKACFQRRALLAEEHIFHLKSNCKFTLSIPFPPKHTFLPFTKKINSSDRAVVEDDILAPEKSRW